MYSEEQEAGLVEPVVACTCISKIPDFGLGNALFQRKPYLKRKSSDQPHKSSIGDFDKSLKIMENNVLVLSSFKSI